MVFLDDESIFEAAKPADLIDAIRRAFRETESLPARLHYDLPGEGQSKLLVMPAWMGRDSIGVKVATVMPSNARLGRPTISGLYVLLDGITGMPLAVLSASALTALRTAAVSGLAASYLARHASKTLLMVGTGALAPYLIQAHQAVRPIERVLIWGRDISKAEGIADRIREMGHDAMAIGDLSDAVTKADVISCATSSGEPIIEGALVRPGTHVDLVGSFAPNMRETDSNLFARGRLTVDTFCSFIECGDLIEPCREGTIDPNSTPTLHDLVLGGPTARRSEDEITIFKAVGTGLADIAAAKWLYDTNRAQQSEPIPPGKAILHQSRS